MVETTSIQISKKNRDVLVKWKYEINAKDYDEVIERILDSNIINPQDIIITEERKIHEHTTKIHNKN